MKSIVKYSALFLMFVITILIMLDVHLITLRKDEIQDALQLSMYNVLKAKAIDRMYPMDEDDMQAEFIREFASNVNADSTVQLEIANISTEGLLDVQAIQSFQHLNGERDVRNLHKTMFVEEYEKDE